MTSFPPPSSPSSGQQCPPPPPSSPTNSRRESSTDSNSQQHAALHHQPQPLPQEQIASLLQFAQSSYTTNPSDALSALMDALTLSTGSNAAAQNAMVRIRSELGDSVADSVRLRPSLHHSTAPAAAATSPLSDREMTQRAMGVVQQLLNDTSTILYSRGKQHILQQAMEDGSSVVCSKCGDMISRERISQHTNFWCRAIEEEKSCDEGESMAMED